MTSTFSSVAVARRQALESARRAEFSLLSPLRALGPVAGTSVGLLLGGGLLSDEVGGPKTGAPVVVTLIVSALLVGGFGAVLWRQRARRRRGWQELKRWETALRDPHVLALEPGEPDASDQHAYTARLRDDAAAMARQAAVDQDAMANSVRTYVRTLYVLPVFFAAILVFGVRETATFAPSAFVLVLGVFALGRIFRRSLFYQARAREASEDVARWTTWRGLRGLPADPPPRQPLLVANPIGVQGILPVLALLTQGWAGVAIVGGTIGALLAPFGARMAWAHAHDRLVARVWSRTAGDTGYRWVAATTVVDDTLLPPRAHPWRAVLVQPARVLIGTDGTHVRVVERARREADTASVPVLMPTMPDAPPEPRPQTRWAASTPVPRRPWPAAPWLVTGEARAFGRRQHWILADDETHLVFRTATVAPLRAAARTRVKSADGVHRSGERDT